MMLISIVCLGVLYIILAFIIGVIWKVHKEDISKLQKQIIEAKNISDKLLNSIDMLSSDCESLKQSQQTVKATVVYSRNDCSGGTTLTTVSNNKKKHKVAKEIRYATLQSPDEHGHLRFSERSMSNSPTAEKMFILYLDPISGTGTYKLNPDAISLILNDLQLFHDFVKPFSFNGNPMNATLKDKKEGRITKIGDFWVVDELLEITIN